MHLQLTPNLDPFILYEVETFLVAVDNQTDHITEIRDLPKYFAAADRSQFYILPTHVDSTDKPHILNLAKSRIPLRSFSGSPTCVSALFKDNRQLIRDLCNFRLLKSSLWPTVNFLTDTHALLLNIRNATLRCSEQRTDIQIPKCLMCTHEISCDCVFRTWNKDGEIEMVFLPKMASCEKHNAETITRSLVNLAVLQHFFNDSQLGRLEGGTLLERNLSITLP